MDNDAGGREGDDNDDDDDDDMATAVVDENKRQEEPDNTISNLDSETRLLVNHGNMYDLRFRFE